MRVYVRVVTVPCMVWAVTGGDLDRALCVFGVCVRRAAGYVMRFPPGMMCLMYRDV